LLSCMFFLDLSEIEIRSPSVHQASGVVMLRGSFSASCGVAQARLRCADPM
jgi:hypothetical protein